MGAVATTLVNLVVIIVIKIIPRIRHVQKRGIILCTCKFVFKINVFAIDDLSLNHKRTEVSMESNKAYELVLQRASSGKAKTSQSKPPIYEIPKSIPPIYEVPK